MIPIPLILAAIAYFDYRRRRSALGDDAESVVPYIPTIVSPLIQVTPRPRSVPQVVIQKPSLPSVWDTIIAPRQAATEVNLPEIPAPLPSYAARKAKMDQAVREQVKQQFTFEQASASATNTPSGAAPAGYQASAAPASASAHALDEGLVVWLSSNAVSLTLPTIVAWGGARASGGAYAGAVVRDAVIRKLMSAVLSPNGYREFIESVSKPGIQLTQDDATTFLESQSVDSKTIREFMVLVYSAGIHAEHAFNEGLAKGVFTSDDVADSMSNPGGYGAEHVSDVISNAVAAVMTPRIAEFTTRLMIKNRMGGKLSDSQIRSVSLRVQKKLEDTIALIGKTGGNVSGQMLYLESVAKQEAMLGLRGLVIQLAKAGARSQVYAKLGTYLNSKQIDTILSASAEDVGNAFLSSGGTLSQSQLEQIAAKSVIKNFVPYIAHIGAKLAGEKINELIGDGTISEDQGDALSEQIGINLMNIVKAKVDAGDFSAVDPEKLEDLGKLVAAGWLAPVLASVVKNKLAEGVSAAIEAAPTWGQVKELYGAASGLVKSTEDSRIIEYAKEFASIPGQAEQYTKTYAPLPSPEHAQAPVDAVAEFQSLVRYSQKQLKESYPPSSIWAIPGRIKRGWHP